MEGEESGGEKMEMARELLDVKIGIQRRIYSDRG